MRKTTAAIAAVAEEERVALHRAKERLADEGIEVSTLSSGSTPTAMLGKDYRGLSELRPGVYLAGDLFQAGLATCTIDDIAISVLASVIAHAPARNELVIDAGGLALSKDRSTEHSPADYGYGLVVRADGSRFESRPYCARSVAGARTDQRRNTATVRRVAGRQPGTRATESRLHDGGELRSLPCRGGR